MGVQIGVRVDFSCRQRTLKLCSSSLLKGILNMTKADLTDRVAALPDISRRDSDTIVETLLESIVSALQSGDKVEIRGFGSFRTRQRNSRTGRNPKTGVSVDVPAKKVSFFKASKELRELIGADVVDDDEADDD